MQIASCNPHTGRVVQVGTPEDLYRRPVNRFAARFFGDLAEVAGPCRGGALATPLGSFPAPGFAEGETLHAAFRPQALRIAPAGEGHAGRVARRVYLGTQVRLEIEAAGFAEPLRLAAPPEDPHRPGEAVGLVLAGDTPFIFSSDGD